MLLNHVETVNKITVEILFCLMSKFWNCFYFQIIVLVLGFTWKKSWDTLCALLNIVFLKLLLRLKKYFLFWCVYVKSSSINNNAHIDLELIINCVMIIILYRYFYWCCYFSSRVQRRLQGRSCTSLKCICKMTASGYIHSSQYNTDIIWWRFGWVFFPVYIDFKSNI